MPTAAELLRVLLLTLQVGVLLLVAYNLLTAFAGWTVRRASDGGSWAGPMRVVVPAHDEARVIAGLLTDLRAQTRAPDRVVVIADRCADDTADVARRLGAQVWERSGGTPGKGAAIADHLARDPLDPGDVLVVLDADNRVPPPLLERIGEATGAGHGAVQAYLDVLEPGSNALVTASALTYWAGNRMVQLARSNLGWSADLGGTGMALTAQALARAGGFADSLTEDQDLGVRLVRSGTTVHWLHDVRVRDEKPDDLGVAVRQRARWMAGKRGVAREHVRGLLGQAVAERRWGPVDVALRLVQPGRSFVALVTGVVAVLATVVPSDWVLPAAWWWTAVAVQFALPIVFLARDGVPGRYLVRYPLVTIVAAIWPIVRLTSARASATWFHTPHRGEGQVDPPSGRPRE